MAVEDVGELFERRGCQFQVPGEPSKRPDLKNRMKLIQQHYSAESIDI
jgi:hypothetical protein